MRIIAGTAKGHTIKAPKGMDTRPTLDRVRESVFNVLAHRGLVQKRVLDLFSGTGALAIESLSRGASHAVAMDKATAKLIKENAEHCHVADKITIVINGSFYAKDDRLPVMENIPGQETDLVINRSTLTTTMAVNSTGSDLSAVLAKLDAITKNTALIPALL